ncbi:hypothetical protein ACO0QE_002635 [Hanseniaspora vineae]
MRENDKQDLKSDAVNTAVTAPTTQENDNCTNDSNKFNAELIETCSNISKQLQNILKVPHLLSDNEDNTMLQGFVLFQHTKLTQLLSLGENSKAPTTNHTSKLLEFSWNFLHNPILKYFIKQKKKILIKYNITQDKSQLSNVNINSKDPNAVANNNLQCIVELRKLNNKFNKLTKKFTEFYTKIMSEYLSYLPHCVGTSENNVVHNTVQDNLDIVYLTKMCNTFGYLKYNNELIFYKKKFLPQNTMENDINVNIGENTVSKNGKNYLNILKSIYHISLALAQINKFTTLMESINYKIAQFQAVLNWCRVTEYISSGSDFFIANFGKCTDHYMILSKCYMKSECFGYAMFYMIKTINTDTTSSTSSLTSSQSSTSSNAGNAVLALQNLHSVMNLDSMSQFLVKLDDMNKDKNNRLIINKEIIESYFLYCWKVHFQDKTTSTDNSQFYKYRWNTLLEKISIRYKKNIVPIYLNLIICIGGFQILLNKPTSTNNSDENLNGEIQSKQSTSLPKEKKFFNSLPQATQDYLRFCFQYINYVLENVIIKEFENGKSMKNESSFRKDYQYLAFVRVLLSWCKSSKLVLQYVHRNTKFNILITKLVNLLIQTNYQLLHHLQSPEATHRPKRDHLFLEDYQLQKLGCLQFNDFNDSQLSMGNQQKKSKICLKMASFLETQEANVSMQNRGANNYSANRNIPTTMVISENDYKLILKSLVYNTKKIVSGNLVNVVLQNNGKYTSMTVQEVVDSRSNSTNEGCSSSREIWGSSSMLEGKDSHTNPVVYSGGSFTLSGAPESTLFNTKSVASSMNIITSPSNNKNAAASRSDVNLEYPAILKSYAQSSSMMNIGGGMRSNSNHGEATHSKFFNEANNSSLQQQQENADIQQFAQQQTQQHMHYPHVQNEQAKHSFTPLSNFNSMSSLNTMSYPNSNTPSQGSKISYGNHDTNAGNGMGTFPNSSASRENSLSSLNSNIWNTGRSPSNTMLLNAGRSASNGGLLYTTSSPSTEGILSPSNSNIMHNTNTAPANFNTYPRTSAESVFHGEQGLPSNGASPGHSYNSYEYNLQMQMNSRSTSGVTNNFAFNSESRNNTSDNYTYSSDQHQTQFTNYH